MNLVDTSGWLEYFAEGPGARHFVRALEDTEKLIVPAICIYEVFKKILRERGENKALQAIALMNQGKVISLDTTLALSAAKISVELKIPMADSIILATAQAHQAIIWTQDNDFENLPGVKFFSKKQTSKRQPTSQNPYTKSNPPSY